MGDHEARGSTSTTTASERSDRDEWNDDVITVVEKRVERSTSRGVPPLERPPASKRDA